MPTRANDGRFRSLLPRGVRILLVIALGVAAAGLVYSWPAQPQDVSYHCFADQRTLLGVPHCLNVLSNLPFLLVGVLGLRFLRSEAGRTSFLDAAERTPYLVFFVGIGLTAVGSAYYHLDPTNDRLLWDRLPMAVAFMSLFAAVIGERIGVRIGSRLLVPLLILGVGSVLYWHWTEQRGEGDLRLYYLVQFYPMAAIPLMLLLFPPRYSGAGALLVALGLYALAKITELEDATIFHRLDVVSGHTLKHIVAAIGAYWILHMLRGRRSANSSNK